MQWPCVVLEQRQEEGDSAEEEHNTQDMDGVVANGMDLAASAEVAVPYQILADRHSLRAEGPVFNHQL